MMRCELTERSWGRRLATSIALAITALAATLLPVTPAHAAYGPDQQVYVQVIANDGSGMQLARLEGTVAFDDSNTKYRYSLNLCWQSGAYPQPSFLIKVNGSATNSPVGTGYTSATGCQQVSLYGADVDFGSAVHNLRFDVTAGWFSSSNGYQYMTRTKSSGTYDNPFT
jgi:hypothetical protein